MKVVKDSDALRRLAKKTGGKVRESEAQPPASDPSFALLSKNIIDSGNANIQMMNELKRQISDINIAPMIKKDLEPVIASVGESIIKTSKENIKALASLREQIVKIPVAEYPDSGPAIEAMSKNIIEAEKSNVMMLNELKKQISDIRLMTPNPITHWEFEFVRDSRGYLERVVADGTPEVKRLN